MLAAAGLRRLGREGEVGFLFDGEEMTPAAGQGALVLQVRADDEASRRTAAGIGDRVGAGGADRRAGCGRRPGGQLRRRRSASTRSRTGDDLTVGAFVGLPDGSEWLRDRVQGGAADPGALGAELADRLLAAGAAELLERAEGLA